MRLTYELTMEDVLAFYRYYYATSPAIRRMFFVARAVFIALVIGSCVAIDLWIGTWMFTIAALLFTAIFLIVDLATKQSQLD